MVSALPTFFEIPVGKVRYISEYAPLLPIVDFYVLDLLKFYEKTNPTSLYFFSFFFKLADNFNLISILNNLNFFS